MYGYLTVQGRHGRTALAPAQCGLCAHFGGRYRTRTRWLAGFDPSVLALLLDGLSPEAAPRGEVRCPIPLARKRTAVSDEWPALPAVAAVQLFLAGEKLFDDRVDRDGMTSRIAARLLRKDIERAEVWLTEAGFPIDIVRRQLRAQRAAEEDPAADLDALATPTADGLAATVEWCAEQAGLHPEARQAARMFGDALGRALYLVDAIDDVREDGARGRFNPLLQALGGVRSPAAASFLRGALEGRLRVLAERLDALTWYRHRRVVRDATVGSLTRKGRAALVAVPAPEPARLLLAGGAS